MVQILAIIWDILRRSAIWSRRRCVWWEEYHPVMSNKYCCVQVGLHKFYRPGRGVRGLYRPGWGVRGLYRPGWRVRGLYRRGWGVSIGVGEGSLQVWVRALYRTGRGGSAAAFLVHTSHVCVMCTITTSAFIQDEEETSLLQQHILYCGTRVWYHLMQSKNEINEN